MYLSNLASYTESYGLNLVMNNLCTVNVERITGLNFRSFQEYYSMNILLASYNGVV